jgi:hypothetical protein
LQQVEISESLEQRARKTESRPNQDRIKTGTRRAKTESRPALGERLGNSLASYQPPPATPTKTTEMSAPSDDMIRCEAARVSTYVFRACIGSMLMHA